MSFEPAGSGVEISVGQVPVVMHREYRCGGPTAHVESAIRSRDGRCSDWTGLGRNGPRSSGASTRPYAASAHGHAAPSPGCPDLTHGEPEAHGAGAELHYSSSAMVQLPSLFLCPNERSFGIDGLNRAYWASARIHTRDEMHVSSRTLTLAP